MVSEFAKRAVQGHMPLVGTQFGVPGVCMHMGVIMLIIIGRYAIYAPMAVDAEFGIAYPFRYLRVLLKGGPVRFIKNIFLCKGNRKRKNYQQKGKDPQPAPEHNMLHNLVLYRTGTAARIEIEKDQGD
jgi:hypothetical protein